MGTTKSKGPWPFKPTLPPEPESASPSALEAHVRDTTDLKAMYRKLSGASNRSEAMRRLMLAGWRASKGDQAETERLAGLGREWEQFFGDVSPGQLASLLDRISARQTGHAGGAPKDAEEARQLRAKAIATLNRSGDMLDGELA